MGIFSKQTILCKKCGKEYKTILDMRDGLCKACYKKKLDEGTELRLEILGYVEYANSVLNKNYSDEEVRAIISHFNELTEKLRLKDGVSRAELLITNASLLRNMDEEDFHDFIQRLKKTIIPPYLGAINIGKFFVLTQFEKIIVDCNDVYAVGFVKDSVTSDSKVDTLLCAFFTNDPYVPIFPMIQFEEKESRNPFKNQKAHEKTTQFFEEMCPNLKYPVTDLKELDKIVKHEEKTRGILDKQFMRDQIYNAEFEHGIFNSSKKFIDINISTQEMLNDLGYLSLEEFVSLLQIGYNVEYDNIWDDFLKNISD